MDWFGNQRDILILVQISSEYMCDHTTRLKERQCRKLYNVINSLLEENSRHKLLDIGCNNGVHTKRIEEHSKAEVTGVDINDEFLSQASGRSIKCLKVDLDEQDLPYPEECFDAVHCNQIIEHLRKTDHLVSEIKRVLKPRGYLILGTPNLASWDNRILLALGYQPNYSEVSFERFYGSPIRGELEEITKPFGHLRLFTKKALIEMLTENGFNMERIVGTSMTYGSELSSPVERFMLNSLNSMTDYYSAISQILVVKARKN